MTETATAETHEFVAYEYTTLRVSRELEALYRDSYRNFGWIVEGYGPAVPGADTVTLKLKRDRRIKNRPMVLELQRKCESALAAIASMERSKTTTANTVAISAGIVGSAFLAGSIFALNGGLIALSIVLGAIGLVGWVAGYFARGRVKASRTAKLAPMIDQQYDLVYETGEQASRLLG